MLPGRDDVPDSGEAEGEAFARAWNLPKSDAEADPLIGPPRFL